MDRADRRALTALRHSSLLGLLLLASTCALASTAPTATDVEERTVSPAAANAAITQFTDDHYVWLPAHLRNSGDRIMLLLPGTGGHPRNARLIGAIAADQGYRAIGLMYVDDRAVVNECAGDPDTACMANMREEIVRGESLSPHVTVDRANSIDGRLADLLGYLAAHYPTEGWSQFLTIEGEPNWDAIAVGGLSQGGGHAAYIAKLRSVPRVVMFGAPADGFSGAVAPWMTRGATPPDRYFGFHHHRDPFTSIDPNWEALGLQAFGAAVDVAASTSEFGGSHMLTTDLLPATGSYGDAHASVFGDGVTPKTNSGRPVFETAWRYLLGAP